MALSYGTDSVSPRRPLHRSNGADAALTIVRVWTEGTADDDWGLRRVGGNDRCCPGLLHLGLNFACRTYFGTALAICGRIVCLVCMFLCLDIVYEPGAGGSIYSPRCRAAGPMRGSLL